MTITNPGHGITLGGLELVSNGQPVVHAAGFTTAVSADGTTWGNPEPVIASLLSAITDGEHVSQTRVSNRQPVLYVRITQDSAGGLTEGERALAAVAYKPVELVWQPPDATEPPTVFDVMHSRMDFEFNDRDELRRTRTYVFTMAALPWGRSAEKVNTLAVTPAAPTVVDSGSATANWSILHPAGATLSVSSGAVRSTYDPSVIYLGVYGTTLVHTATIDVSVNKYMAFDWKSSLAATHQPAFDGAYGNVEVRREPAPTAGFTRSWYRIADSITSLSSVSFSIFHPAGSGTATLDIDQIILANALPGGRQLTRIVDPGGSVTAEGDVKVQHGTTGLGQVIVYSHPAGGGYSPPLRPWLAASDTVTTDASLVSGANNPLVGATGFSIPADSVPTGDVQLWARMGSASGTGTVTINWAAEAYMNATIVGDTQTGGTQVTFPTAGPWLLFPLARLTLPPAHMGSAGRVRILLQRDPASGIDVRLDEAWLFAMDRGRLTVVDCGSGAPTYGTISNRMKVTAPSLDEPFGSIMVGVASDWSDAFTPPAAKVQCDQTGHRFDPTGSTVFAVTSNVSDGEVSFEHYPRWHSNAGAT